MNKRITPAEAFANSEKSKKSAKDVIEAMYLFINRSSDNGRTSCSCGFTREALLPGAIDEAYDELQKEGWAVQLGEVDCGYTLKISFNGAAGLAC